MLTMKDPIPEKPLTNFGVPAVITVSLKRSTVGYHDRSLPSGGFLFLYEPFGLAQGLYCLYEISKECIVFIQRCIVDIIPLHIL
jgi:hypothetical protein